MLCFIDSDTTPKIAFDRDDLAEPLIAKVKQAVGDHEGSESVFISFGPDEKELGRQFHGVCTRITQAFEAVVYCTKP